MAPGTEAPAEMHFYFPKFRALCMAENATHNLHNLLTLRGALVRDPHGWAGYLTEAIDTFADRADVVFASHHWPTWGKDHDRRIPFPATGYVRLSARPDVAPAQPGIHRDRDRRELPDAPALDKAWHTHGYYGSVSHNVKAVYQRYMGWFDGNPGRLWAHPPEAIAPRYVEAMGGVDRVVEIARKAFDDGDFRWAATLLDHAIFTDQNHAGARELYADTLEQLAYGAENAVWRNFFLSGATELREGNFGTPTQTASPSIMGQLTPEQMFDTFAINLNGPRAWDLDVAVDVAFLDTATNYRLTLRNGVLVYRKATAEESTAQATSSWRTSCGCWHLPRRRRLAWARDHRRHQRDAVDLRGGGPARPGLQHRHAVALGHAAVDADDRPAGVGRRIRRQIQSCADDFGRIAQPLEREVLCAFRRRRDVPGLADVGEERARHQRVDPDRRPEGQRKAFGQRVEPRLRGRIRQLPAGGDAIRSN